MKIATGKVIGGKVIVDGEALVDGTSVTVISDDDEKLFGVSAEQEAALLASIAEVERGEVISAEELFARLRRSA